MAPKQKGGYSQEAKATPPSTLQGVLLADWWGDAYEPATTGPLATVMGVTVLEMGLRWMISNCKVKELFIVTSSKRFAEKEQVVDRWKERHARSTATVTLLQIDVANVGAAFRELDRRKLLIDDFVLAAGNVITMNNVTVPVEEHKLRRKKNKDAIMTRVMLPASEAAQLLVSPLEHASLAYHGSTKEIFQCARGVHAMGQRFAVSAPVLKDFFKQGVDAALEVRHGLVHTNVDICAPEVLQLFSEHFDFEEVHSDTIVRSMITSKYEDEVSSQTTHVCVVDEATAAAGNILNLAGPGGLHRAGMALAKSQRSKQEGALDTWARLLGEAALDPERNSFLAGGVLRCDGPGAAALAGDVKSCMMGAGVVVEGSAKVENCIIGNNVSIGAESELLHCVIGDNCKIGKDCSVVAGSVLAPGTVLDDEDNHMGDEARPLGMRALAIWSDKDQKTAWDKVVDEAQEAAAQRAAEDAAADADVVDDDFSDAYHSEMKQMIVKSLEGAEDESTTMDEEHYDGLLVELRSMRMGANRSCEDTVKGIAYIMMQRYFLAESEARKTRVLELYGKLFREFRVRDSIDEMIVAIDTLFDMAVADTQRMTAAKFCNLLEKLYKKEAFGDESDVPIVQWHRRQTQKLEGLQSFLQGRMDKFVEWLQEEDDDDDEESESGS